MLTLSLILHGPGKNSLQSSPVRCELCIELICVREPHHYIGSWTRPLNAAHHRWHYILFNSVQMNLLGESMPAANLSYYAIFLFFISQSGVKINNDHIHKRHNHLLEFLVCMPILGYIYIRFIFWPCVSDLNGFYLQLVLWPLSLSRSRATLQQLNELSGFRSFF